MRTVEICRALFYRRLILFFILLISCFIKCKIHHAFKERETTTYSMRKWESPLCLRSTSIHANAEIALPSFGSKCHSAAILF